MSPITLEWKLLVLNELSSQYLKNQLFRKYQTEKHGPKRYLKGVKMMEPRLISGIPFLSEKSPTLKLIAEKCSLWLLLKTVDIAHSLTLDSRTSRVNHQEYSELEYKGFTI